MEPRTIEGLAQWYRMRGLPPAEVTRFFIGVDYPHPKAFGIYEDENGDFVVYKNKADGTRAIRYKGKDEAHAVNELYARLKEEIVNQKNNSLSDEEIAQIKAESDRNLKKKVKRSDKLSNFLFLVGTVLMCALFGYNAWSDKKAEKYNGYYKYEDDTYYRYGDSWYLYDSEDSESWRDYKNSADSKWNLLGSYDVPEPLTQSGEDYFEGADWTTELDSPNFRNSTTYKEMKEKEASSKNYDNDSDYDWGGNDTWDNDTTDWDSDW